VIGTGRHQRRWHRAACSGKDGLRDRQRTREGKIEGCAYRPIQHPVCTSIFRMLMPPFVTYTERWHAQFHTRSRVIHSARSFAADAFACSTRQRRANRQQVNPVGQVKSVGARPCLAPCLHNYFPVPVAPARDTGFPLFYSVFSRSGWRHIPTGEIRIGDRIDLHRQIRCGSCHS